MIKKIKVIMILKTVLVLALTAVSFSLVKAETNVGVGSEPNIGRNEAGAICKSKCGDSVCDKVVCLAEGCPCAENSNNCSKDCPASNTDKDKPVSNDDGQNQNAKPIRSADSVAEHGGVAGQNNSENIRSAVVGNFVQSLLRVASTTARSASSTVRGIGEQVRLIAQEQNDSEATTNRAIEKVQLRSKVKTFFLGTDYKNLGALRSQVASTTNRIRQLNQVMPQIHNASDTAEVQGQIQALEQEQSKIDNFVKEQESKFSLFGWLVKLFNRQ
jgi:hypothetical protein